MIAVTSCHGQALAEPAPGRPGNCQENEAAEMLVKVSMTHAMSLTVRQCGHRRTADERGQVSHPLIRITACVPLYLGRA